METKVLTAHIPAALAKRIDKLSENLERPRTWIIKQALGAWVELEEERHRMTLEAIEEADAGHVIDHESILEWVNSLGTKNPKPVPTK